MFTVNSEDTGIYITEIFVNAGNVTIKFNGTLEGRVRDDDVLLLDENDIKTDGKLKSQWNKEDEYRALRLAGRGIFLDVGEMYDLGVRGRFVRTQDGPRPIDYDRMTLAVNIGGGIYASTRTFEPADPEKGISWKVTSRARTGYRMR